MLTEQEKGIVKETVPVLQERGTEITSYFYNRMFQQHPELKNMFNQTNQQKGFQSTALAQSVLAAAVNIEHLENILPVVKEIAYKPVSYTHLTLPTKSDECRSRWSPYH